MILTLIAIGEVAFWLVLGGGLAIRYLLRRPRLSTAVLLCVPLIDIGLLTATTLDLRGGGDADFTHGLAFAYLGFTVAFGPHVIRWADVRFAHRFADGPPPHKIPRHGPERIRHEWALFRRAVAAGAIACGLLAIAIALIADADRSEELQVWLIRLAITVGVWAIWPLSATFSRTRTRDAL